MSHEIAQEPVPFYPLNDLSFLVSLSEVDPATGKSIPLTTGTVTAFFTQNSFAPDAVAADPSLVATASHVGKGRWLVTFDAVALDPTLLATLFASDTPYLILEHAGGSRTYVALEYHESRAAVVVT